MTVITAQKIIYSRQNETLSAIAYRIYGQSGGNVEALLAINPHLARYPAQLPEGVPITLPVIEQQTTQTLTAVNLWD